MGKGDKKTRRGKIVIGSYGVKRARKKKKGIVVPPKPKEIEIIAKPLEEPVKVILAETVIAEKKPVKKAPAKKAAIKTEDAGVKPKSPKPRKKSEPKEQGPAAEPGSKASKE